MALAASLFLVLVLSWWGACRSGESFWNGLFTGLQVVFNVFEGDSETFREYAVCFPHVYGILSCAVPVLTVFAALHLLWNYLPHHVPFKAKQWYIFSELDANSIRMANSLSDEDHLCIFLRSHRDKVDQELLKELQKVRYFLYPKDESRFLLWPWRRKHIMRFFFLSDNTDENFNRMQEFLSAVEDSTLFAPQDTTLPDGRFQQELYLLSETESASMLIDHLRRKLSKDGVRLPVFQNTELRLLDRFRATSYNLLLNKPLYECTHNGKLNVLILGFGRIGREFFRAAASMGVIHDCCTEFTICDLQINRKLNAFMRQCPELACSVHFRAQELDAETDQLDDLIYGGQFHYILIALGDDERNIRIASRLKLHYRRLHWNNEARKKHGFDGGEDIHPQVCVNIEDSIKRTYSEELWKKTFSSDRDLEAFGGLDQVFNKDVLMPENLWRAARWIHQELNRTDTSEPYLVGAVGHREWTEYERRSSIACAAHAEYYVAAVGKNYQELLTQWKTEKTEVGRSKYDHLVDTEHHRWMAYVRSEGLRKSGTDLVDVYYDKDYGRHVDILGRLTPCLVDNEQGLEKVWKHLEKHYTDDFKGKLPFRERDKLLVLNADIIQRGILTGEFPEQAIRETT